jgi:hypothetical protein
MHGRMNIKFYVGCLSTCNHIALGWSRTLLAAWGGGNMQQDDAIIELTMAFFSTM